MLNSSSACSSKPSSELICASYLAVETNVANFATPSSIRVFRIKCKPAQRSEVSTTSRESPFQQVVLFLRNHPRQSYFPANRKFAGRLWLGANENDPALA